MKHPTTFLFVGLITLFLSWSILATDQGQVSAASPTLPPMPPPWVAPTRTPTPTPPKPIRNFYPVIIAKPNLIAKSTQSQVINTFTVTDVENDILTVVVSRLPKYWSYSCNSIPGQSTCTIIGAPKTLGTFSYTIKAVDSKDGSRTKSISTRVIKLASNKTQSATSY